MSNIRNTEKRAVILDGIKGIVFDLDDTLYLQRDFKISGFHAVARWIEDNGYSARQDTMAILHTILDQLGPSYPYMFNRLVEQLSFPETLIPQLVQVFVQHRPQIGLFHGVRDMLMLLRGKHTLGILTDGRLDVQRAKIKALGLEPLVDAILYSDVLGLSKPAGELYAWFEDHFQQPGPKLAYIGDNPAKDFIGANRRGWLTIRVLTGEFATIPAAERYNAKRTLNHAAFVADENPTAQ